MQEPPDTESQATPAREQPGAPDTGTSDTGTSDTGISDTGISDSGISDAEQAESLARIERGAITVAAERRLRELRERGGLFTSDLSVNGWALCHRLELRPLAQVMGSSIYQMGYQGAWGQQAGGYDPFGASMFELNTLSEALNEVRSRALGRLAEEARHVGADAVVGVSTNAGESDLGTGSVTLEHTAVGTAVSRAGRPSGANRPSGTGRHGASRPGRPEAQAQPVLTELSVADFTKLVQAGFEPLGIVAWSAVFFATAFGPGGLGGTSMMVGATQNFELREFTQAFYNARETVMAQLNYQANALGASGIVGVRIGHNAVRQTLSGGMGGRERSGLMVTFNAIGTAIGQRESPQLYPPEMTIDLTT
jgi:uncharacterized protein YbjQ (UPF0145 family)